MGETALQRHQAPLEMHLPQLELTSSRLPSLILHMHGQIQVGATGARVSYAASSWSVLMPCW